MKALKTEGLKQLAREMLKQIKEHMDSLARVASTGSYNDLADKPSIPDAVRVKGAKESAYHTGDVNLTPGNLGAVDAGGDTMTGDLTFPNTAGIVQKQIADPNYSAIARWDEENGGGTYPPQIGRHNTGGDGSGAVVILPYASQDKPYEEKAGLYIAKGSAALDGKELLTEENYGEYVKGFTQESETQEILARLDRADGEIQALQEADEDIRTAKADAEKMEKELANRYTKDKVYTKDEVLKKIQDLIGTAPETLDTFKEIAEALGNDPNFATTIMTALAGKVDKEGGKVLSANDYTDDEKAALADVKGKSHSHTNKSVLDKITQALVDTWNSALTALPAHKHLKSDITDIPTSMKNPSALTFTGGSTAKYDGSAEKTVEIPTIDSLGAVKKDGDTMTGPLKVRQGKVGGDIESGGVEVGDRVIITSNTEGGNICIVAPDGTKYEFDAYNGNFRLVLVEIGPPKTTTTPFAIEKITGITSFIGVKLSGQNENRVPYLNASKQLVSSAVTPQELDYLAGVKSNIQQQINDITKDLGGVSFGITDDGRPGYKKDGADKVYPFNSILDGILNEYGFIYASNNIGTLIGLIKRSPEDTTMYEVKRYTIYAETVASSSSASYKAIGVIPPGLQVLGIRTTRTDKKGYPAEGYAYENTTQLGQYDPVTGVVAYYGSAAVYHARVELEAVDPEEPHGKAVTEKKVYAMLGEYVKDGFEREIQPDSTTVTIESDGVKFAAGTTVDLTQDNVETTLEFHLPLGNPTYFANPDECDYVKFIFNKAPAKNLFLIAKQRDDSLWEMHPYNPDENNTTDKTVIFDTYGYEHGMYFIIRARGNLILHSIILSKNEIK